MHETVSIGFRQQSIAHLGQLSYYDIGMWREEREKISPF